MRPATQRLAGIGTAAVLALTATSACSTSEAGGNSPGKHSGTITIGFGNGGVGFDFLDQQARMLKVLAARHHWKTVILNNNSDGPTAVKNVDEFIKDKVDYVIEFQIDSTVNPVISKKLHAAGIPVVTEAIPGPGMYFTSVDDHAAGVAAGKELGNYAKSKWNCQPDMVFLIKSTPTGDASTLRVGGDKDGIKQVCPNIPDSTFVYAEASNDNDKAISLARAALAAHPNANRILVGGLSDGAVADAITAAEQLHRANQLYAWGGDGGLLQLHADPHFGGSIEFFLEAGILPAFTIVSDLAAGKKVHKGFSPKDPTLLGETCSMTLAQAKKLPTIVNRANEELKTYPAKTPAQLFCPKG